MKLEKKYIVRDAALVVVLLVAAVLFMLNKGEKGNTVEIYTNGKLYATCPISTDRTVIVETEYGKNKVVIENGAVFVIDADCPNKDCVRSGKISRSGQCISCLPNKITVIVSGKSAVDGVTG